MQSAFLHSGGSVGTTSLHRGRRCSVYANPHKEKRAKEKSEGFAIKMPTGEASGGFQDRQTDERIVLLAVIAWGLLFPVGVDAWTYHYGDKSDLTWKEARVFCQTWFTDLVAIQNQEEIAYLNAVVPFYKKYYWIGIRKINNTWTWVGTNKKLTKEAENWAYREPNNRRDNQDCVEIYIKRDREAGKWNDEPCTKKKRALCYQASCHPSSCNERSECVETIGNHTCQCYPGYFGPECEYVVKCRDLSAIHKPLRMNCNHPLGDFSYRSSCAFSCEEGLELSGLATLQCLPSGNWTAEIPQCIAVQCKPLKIPDHGDFNCSHVYGEFQYQSTCNFKCAEGFAISGAENIMCKKSGEWSSPAPTCQVKQCQEIESPRRGTMDCVNPIGDFAYNSTCDFSCEDGFQLNGSKTLHCNAAGQWSSHVPFCQGVQCQPLQALAHGNSSCFHIHGEFQYQSNCTFNCDEGFSLLGEGMILCTARGQWTNATPVCQAIECPKLEAPKNGQLNCSHPHGYFAYNSSCAFSCDVGFVRVGSEMLNCMAQGEWTGSEPVCEVQRCPKPRHIENMRMNCSHPLGSFGYRSACHFRCAEGYILNGKSTMMCQPDAQWSAEIPFCQAVQCHSLQRPEKGSMTCSHPVDVFAFQSSCEFSCEPGFNLTGIQASHCLATGNWSAAVPTCQAIECKKLDAPENGQLNCFHPYGDFMYRSSCVFYCNSGFTQIGAEQLQCSDVGTWTEEPPFCEATKCPALQKPDNGHLSCLHPHANFAYGSSCNFSCSVGFQLVGLGVLDCLARGNWTEQVPHCKASMCPMLHAPVNGQLNCSHPHGYFAYNSSCAFSCDVGFVRVGSEMLNCMTQGEWTGSEPVCEVQKCPKPRDIKNMRMNCSHPLGSFGYRSACHFRCAEGYILNGTNTVKCQSDARWSAEMPFCQETKGPFLKQVLLYTGSVAASLVALTLSGGLIGLAIKRLNRRGERKTLLSHTSDLGVPGVFSNSAFDSGS
nr:P-selectin-like [Anolis sagrei ordinatus]